MKSEQENTILSYNLYGQLINNLTNNILTKKAKSNIWRFEKGAQVLLANYRVQQWKTKADAIWFSCQLKTTILIITKSFCFSFTVLRNQNLFL